MRYRSPVFPGLALIVDLDGATSPDGWRLQPGRVRASFRLEGGDPLRERWEDVVEDLLLPLLARPRSR